jgi:hypothetical protein
MFRKTAEDQFCLLYQRILNIISELLFTIYLKKIIIFLVLFVSALQLMWKRFKIKLVGPFKKDNWPVGPGLDDHFKLIKGALALKLEERSR